MYYHSTSVFGKMKECKKLTDEKHLGISFKEEYNCNSQIWSSNKIKLRQKLYY